VVEKIALGVVVGFVILLLSAALAALSAAVFMILLSLIHEDIPAVPALGFWASFAIIWTVSIIGSAWRGSEVNFK
jgi:hypothetical protein